MPDRTLHTALACSLLALSLPSCGPKGGPTSASSANTPLAACAFDPVSIRIHPLTQIDRAPTAGNASPTTCGLTLHVELRDRFGDAVKGLGSLRVQLYRPGVGTAPGLETQELNWDVPQLADPEQNSLRYDPVTRTYKIPLVVPAWVCEWASKKNEDPKVSKDAADWLKLRVVLSRPNPQGQPVYIDDEFVLQR